LLRGILQSTREELERRKRELPQRVLEDRARAGTSSGGERLPGAFRTALTQPGMAVIAEFKRRSPSAGTLREQADLHEVIPAYERGGASALSVLTERRNFGGSLEDLWLARGLCALPVLRKDFVVDEYQLLEARAAGADAVLLIVAALDGGELRSLHAAAGALGLDVLVEVHDRDELERALGLGAELIGINNRDLRDFSVDVGRTTLLMGSVPGGVTVVSESGISSAGQLRGLEREGVQAVLVGESLMRSPDPRRALERLIGRDRDTQDRDDSTNSMAAPGAARTAAPGAAKAAAPDSSKTAAPGAAKLPSAQF
jgi:indole-3-glycerol phosphate synthase